MIEGHDQPCYYCKKLCCSYAGNPSMWPIPLCHEDEPGVVKWHHTGCVSERLWQLEQITKIIDNPIAFATMLYNNKI